MKKFSVFLVLFCLQVYDLQAHVVCLGNNFYRLCQGINYQNEPVRITLSGPPQNRYISGFIGSNGMGLKLTQIQNTIRLQGYFGQKQINVQAYEVQNIEFATGHVGMENFNLRTYKNGDVYHIIGFIGFVHINEYTTSLDNEITLDFQMPFIPISARYFLKHNTY